MGNRWGLLWIAGALPWLCAAAALAAAPEDGDGGGYPLDHLPRTLDRGQPLPCGGTALVTYRGEHLRHDRVARVHPAFVAHLRAFEALVTETARAHYGRAPSTLLSLGTHNCRRMRRYPDWVSEHALGNAIDVAGFGFDKLGRAELLPEDLPRALRGRFTVRLDAHWTATRGLGARHAAFLHDLARRVMARPALFRVVLGPAWPGHHNHFHLDMAPYRMVEVF
jgi:hypothetical protein